MKYASFTGRNTALYLCAALFVSCGTLYAQLDNLFGSSGKRSKSKDDTPTVINSDAMDMDMANDKIILLGNVDVQDDQMNIKCRKMVIFLGKTKAPQGSKGASAGGKSNISGGKSVIRIECTGDVVITQREENGAVSQQTFSNRAIYFVPEEKIVLSEKPVVVKGTSRLEGETITLFTKTDRVLVVKPVSTFRGQVLGTKKSN